MSQKAVSLPEAATREPKNDAPVSSAPSLTASSKKNRERRASRKWQKRMLAGALVVLALAAIAWALVPKPVLVESTLAVRKPMSVTIDEDGIARIQDRYVISAPLTGQLERIELDPGDLVKSGEPLARILPIAAPLLDARTRTEAEARLSMALDAQNQVRLQVERAASSHAFAKEDAERKRMLFANKALSRELLDQAELVERTSRTELESLRFGLKVATHEAEMARATVGRIKDTRHTTAFEIRSPVDGKILRIIQESEGVVQASTPLLEIGDPAALEIAVDVLTSDAVRIKPSARVLFERWGGKTLEGRVRRVDPSAFTRISALGVEEQRVNVIIDLTSPRELWEALGDGYRVETRIVVSEANDVLQVPGSAVFRKDEGWAAFKIVNNKIVRTPVELGERTPRAVAITRGLAAGDRVVLHPSDQVRDGIEVALR